MAHLIANTFSAYAMTEDDVIQSSILTIDQEQNIQNQISLLAERKIAYQPSSTNFDEYIQKEAYYRGQIDALKHLLECSKSAVELLRNPPTQQSQD